MASAASDRTVRVLLVDDNPGDRDLAEERLAHSRTECFVVDSAATLRQALERLSHGTYDVVLLDLGLPDSQGIDTYRTVQARAPDIPVVILTGSEDDAMAREALNAGVQDYLVKDWDDATLTARSVRYAVERKQLLVQLERERKAREQEREASAHDGLSRWQSTSVTARLFGQGPLREVNRPLFGDWVADYAHSIRMSLDNRVTRSQHAVSDRLRAMADRLGRQSAGPRDVIELHQAAMGELCRNANARQVEAYTDEGRFLLLELMGYLASFYRSYYPGITGPAREWTITSAAGDIGIPRDRG